MSVPDRYSRHVKLRQIGEHGLSKIRQSRVLVAGLGALGSLVSLLLARAGVGFLRIVDLDAPELHNLHRQILYDESDVRGRDPKAICAARHLRAGNSEITIEPVVASIGPDNVDDLVRGVDVVVDALDNIAARYVVNDRIIAHHIPYVFGGAVETVGNVMTIIPGKTPCLRCLWPDPAAVNDHPRAATVGVLSSAASTVASIQVTETLKILTGHQDDIISGLLVMDLWRNRFHVAQIGALPGCLCRTADCEDSR